MAKYKNRSGIVVELDPSNKRIAAKILEGEFTVCECEAPKPIPVVSKEPAPAAEDLGEVVEYTTLEDLHAQFEEKFDKPVSMRYKNDAEWIISKLSE